MESPSGWLWLLGVVFAFIVGWLIGINIGIEYGPEFQGAWENTTMRGGL